MSIHQGEIMANNSLRKRLALGAAAAVAATALLLTGCASNASTGDYITEGKITVGTGEPAYYPYVIDDTPESGEGFEAAVAYAVAEKLGFAAEDVVWVRTTFDAAIAPGAKDFDFNLQQYSITEERKANVDFSSSYYSAPQAVITVEGSKAAGVTDIAGLKGLLVGAASGTTSFTVIENVIAPTAGAQAFNSNDDAVLALTSGQIDALVVDLPTAFYLTGAELDAGLLLGQLPAADGVSDEWGFVLPKGSKLTAAITTALDELKADGTLDAIIEKWLGADAGAPLLK
jgi:polar amino acid transport system substrate-binding protein